MKILFIMLNGGYVRNYEGVLRQLAADGHEVTIAIELSRDKGNENLFGERLAAENPLVTVTAAATPEEHFWTSASRIGRLLVDCLRYAHPDYRHATALRLRARLVVPRTFRWFADLVLRLGRWPAAAIIWAICRIERVAPLSRAVRGFLERERPDVLLLTPLVEPGSIQVEYVKCARRMGIPSALGVASWDNLTNKGLMRLPPDRVFVWNQVQHDEAVRLHGVPAAHVVITGAQIFDHWFGWRPRRSRDEFCRMVGLDPARPYLLFVGSSFFIAPNEAEFGEHWIATVRRADDPVVASAGLLIRPHPSSGSRDLWYGLPIDRWDNTAIWPPAGGRWIDMTAPEFREDFFDSLYHSAGVVGVNTSAQIEAAIVGKAVCTVRLPEFVHSQDETLHFQYLTGGSGGGTGGGLLHVAQSLDEHVVQLGEILRHPEAQAEQSRLFVDSFVRPFGRDVAAGPRLAAAIVELAASPSRAGAVPRPEGAGVRLAQWLLTPVAAYVAWLPDRRRWFTYLLLRPLLWLVIPIAAIPFHLHVLFTSGIPQVAGWPVWTRLSRQASSRLREAHKAVRKQWRTTAHRSGVRARAAARKPFKAGRWLIDRARSAARTGPAGRS